MANVYCKKCLTSGYGDQAKQVAGQPCQTPNCDGILERQPEWDELVDILPEPMTCGRRVRIPDPAGIFKVDVGNKTGLDRWQKFKLPHGNRVCSYCGSLHPEDFFALVAQSAQAPIDAKYGSVVEIEPSDKYYKIYVHQPGVRNASEGAIKFYVQHLPGYGERPGPVLVTPEQEAQFKLAVTNTDIRFKRILKRAI